MHIRLTIPTLITLLAACDLDIKNCIGACAGDTDGGGDPTGDIDLGGEIGSCEIDNTIADPTTCEDGVVQPGELCFFGVLGFGNQSPYTSLLALPLDAAHGHDLLYTREDGSFTAELFAPTTSMSKPWAPGTVPASLRLAAAGDFNEDGIVDALGYFLQEGTYGGVTLLLDGQGGLAAMHAQFLSADIVALDASDWDGDGHLDLVLISGLDPQGENLAVLLGDGTGEFAGQPQQSLPNPSPIYALGDLDGDGRGDDFVFASAGGMIVRHDGGQQHVALLDLPPELTLVDLAIADVDDDGLGDILGLADNTDHDTSEVVVALGAADFAADRYPVQCGAHALAVGDLDSDGILDIVTAGDSGPATFRRGDGQGGFAAVRRVPADAIGPGDPLIIADLEGDGTADLIGAGSENAMLFVAYNRP